jgi:hypothetical protein
VSRNAATPYFLIHQSRAGTAHPPVICVPTMAEWAEARRARRSWLRRLLSGSGQPS